MTNTVFFFGAGASAPFGIPTMQGMVKEFEKTLQTDTKSEERRLYDEVCTFLNATLGRPTDLEAVFSVVESIMNWSPDRMGVAALFHATRVLRSGQVSEGIGVPSPPSADEARIASSLEADFERFVQRACQLREGMSENIATVYQNFFARIAGPANAENPGPDGRHPFGNWPMFTTNYDAILEHYWLDIVQVALNTGFGFNSVARMEVSNPEALRGGGLRLFKLHGSITWLLDDRWGLTEQRVPPEAMKTYTGRKFRGPGMLYPIEEKDLYVEPYETMYLVLNRELAQRPWWIAIGYSFGDRIIRGIFERNSRQETRLVLVHPRANEIATRLAGFKGTIRPVQARFGESDYAAVNEAIGKALLS